MRRSSHPLLVSLLLITLVESASGNPAPPGPADPIDRYLIEEMQRSKIPGLVLAVVKDGKVIKQGTYGVANRATQEPVTAQTTFQLASTTKNFSATAVLLLVQDGKLSVDDSIGALLQNLPSTWNRVKVRQLLTHTSGLPDITLRPGGGDLIATNREDALSKLATMALAGEPGAAWAYNQTNYMLLGMIIERLSDQPFEAFITTRIFTPLGMTSTTYDTARTLPHRAQNYAPDGDTLTARNLSFPPYVRMAAGVYTNLSDMIRWSRALDRGTPLKPEWLATMWQPVRRTDGTVFRLDGKTMGYGMGWVSNQRPGHWSVGHSGGGVTAYARFIDDRVAIIMMHNGQADPDRIVEGVARLVIPGLPEPSR